ncbi:unnamed protein product [Symbiodinium necroappetens]|uniref:Uncharacterized protein n=1 Tax=Symbiodinium necroappetens TaxID=1628268 RepID=A0A812RXJ4_9DINO|nr:unnamed protein product [Symbiodinium necroappetens]
MTRCEGKEVLLLHSALRKYVPMPRDEEIDSFGQTVEDKADLLQELLMGLADHFGVDAPAAVDLSNLGNSFLQELYQMLSHVKAEVVAMATCCIAVQMIEETPPHKSRGILRGRQELASDQTLRGETRARVVLPSVLRVS